ncbi:MAG: SH3 domain-containing protein [Pirellulales bacterium]
MPRYVRFLASCLAALACVGCSGQSPPASIEGDAAASSASGGSFDRNFPYVIRQDAEYYVAGPQQGSAPDGKFAAGTQVKVRRQTGGYWLVESADGVTGYVDSQSVSDPSTDGALP